MNSPRQKQALFTPTEVNLIENFLKMELYPDSPTELQLCNMAQQLQSKILADRTTVDLAVYLNSRVQKRQRQNINQTPKAGTTTIYSGALFKQFAQFKPKQEQVLKQKYYTCKSKRKIRPTEITNQRNSLEEFVHFQDNNTSDCRSIFERKNRKNILQKDQSGVLQETNQWIFNEHFYCSCDRIYFKEDQPMRRILGELKMLGQKTTYLEQRQLRRALPKPNLFSAEFVYQQIEKLNQFRNQARTIPKHRSRNEVEMGVGRQVVAVHPICGHLHSGSILAIYRQNQYMIKFIKPQLGTQKVLDVNMMPKEVNNPHRVVVENIDFEVMALAIKLLEYKNDLIKQLKVYNDRAEALQRQNESLDNKFYQEYGWIGSTINILTLGLRHIISKFRIRGVTPANQEKVGRHFATILLSPLDLIDKELEKSSQHSDAKASNQIKKIISNYKENKTEHYSKELFTKYWPSIRDLDWPNDKKGEIERLLKSLVGLLVNLKIENRNFIIEDNKYVSELIAQIDGTFPEHVNEIYETLNSITSKLNEEVK